MSNLDTLAIKDLGWCDAAFYGFAWEKSGTDLRLFIEHASRPVTSIVCHWASDLRVDLTWHSSMTTSEGARIRRMGPLLTWDVTMRPTADQRWTVALDFGGDGLVSFECEEMSASISDDAIHEHGRS